MSAPIVDLLAQRVVPPCPTCGKFSRVVGDVYQCCGRIADDALPALLDQEWCKTVRAWVCRDLGLDAMQGNFGSSSFIVIPEPAAMIWGGEFWKELGRWKHKHLAERLPIRQANRLRATLLPMFVEGFRKAVPEWAQASVGDLWLADARSLVCERAFRVRDRFFMPGGRIPKIGKIITLDGRKFEVVSGIEFASRRYVP